MTPGETTAELIKYMSSRLLEVAQLNTILASFGDNTEWHIKMVNQAVRDGKGFPAGCKRKIYKDDIIWWCWGEPVKVTIVAEGPLIKVCGDGLLCEQCGQAAGLEW